MFTYLNSFEPLPPCPGHLCNDRRHDGNILVNSQYEGDGELLASE